MTARPTRRFGWERTRAVCRAMLSRSAVRSGRDDAARRYYRGELRFPHITAFFDSATEEQMLRLESILGITA